MARRTSIRTPLDRVGYAVLSPLAFLVGLIAVKVSTSRMTKTLNPYRVREPFHGTTVVEIPVRSGKLIVSDDLRTTPFFKVAPPASLNYGAGLDEWTKACAEQAQLAQAFVGNTDPRITRQQDGSLIVVSPAWSEETGERILVNDETIVGRICTDHWSVQMADYEQWLSHGGPAIEVANEPYAIDYKFSIVGVTPGLYRWTVYSADDDFQMDGPGRIEYAKLELIQAY